MPSKTRPNRSSSRSGPQLADLPTSNPVHVDTNPPSWRRPPAVDARSGGTRPSRRAADLRNLSFSRPAVAAASRKPGRNAAGEKIGSGARCMMTKPLPLTLHGLAGRPRETCAGVSNRRRRRSRHPGAAIERASAASRDDARPGSGAGRAAGREDRRTEPVRRTVLSSQIPGSRRAVPIRASPTAKNPQAGTAEPAPPVKARSQKQLPP